MCKVQGRGIYLGAKGSELLKCSTRLDRWHSSCVDHFASLWSAFKFDVGIHSSGCGADRIDCAVTWGDGNCRLDWLAWL